MKWYTLPNISRNKDTQKLKFRYLTEYNTENIIFFFKNHTGNETGRLVSDLFLVFKIALYDLKSKWFAA